MVTGFDHTEPAPQKRRDRTSVANTATAWNICRHWDATEIAFAT
jgi:hypothetical protein